MNSRTWSGMIGLALLTSAVVVRMVAADSPVPWAGAGRAVVTAQQGQGETSDTGREGKSSASQNTTEPGVREGDQRFCRPGSTVAIVPIRGTITDVTYRSVTLRVNKARKAGAEAIVLEMDTPGGLVTSALDLCTFIKNLPEPTLAWVHPDAYSAGAMISLAADGVVMSSRSKIGDCAPIMISPTGQGLQSLPDTERAKIQSPILEEFRDSARRNGYDLTLCEAMVRVGPAIYKIARRDDPGQVRYVWADELGQYQLQADGQPSAEPKRGLAGLFAGRSDSPWQIVEKVLDEGQLLTLSQDEAVKYGFARAIVSDEAELAAWLGTGPDRLIRFEPQWSEQLAVFLTLPLVQGALSLFFMMGVYMEMKTPGLGVGAAVAVICLLILLGAPYLTGLAEVWEIILILVGVVLLALEIFVIPGFGVAGLTGLALLFCGMVLLFVQSEPGNGGILPTLPRTWWQLRVGVATLVGTMLLAVVLFTILSKHYGSIPLLRRLVLYARHERPKAAVEGSPAIAPVEASTGKVNVKVGQTGRAVSTLRPSGRVEIDGALVDALTTGGWVEPGRPVKVVEVQDCRVVVEEL